MMAILIGGVALGFVLSFALFVQKVWRLEDKAEHYRKKAEFYKEECLRQHKQKVEWERASCDSRDLFTKF